MQRFAYGMLAALMLVLSGCGGSGGGPAGGGGTAPVAAFSPDPAPATGSRMALIEEVKNGDLITLAVNVADVAASTVGAAFDLVFDPAQVKFIGDSAGDFFEQGGASVSYQTGLQAGTTNQLVVGVAQQGGAGASGSGTVVRLQFQILALGDSPVQITNSNLIDTTGNLVSGVNWTSGKLSGKPS